VTDRIRVLIAEDEEEVRSALADVIRGEASLELVAEAADAAEAADLAERHRPDVALLDVRMPGGGGARAAVHIRERSPRTHVVAFSAYDDRESVREMLGAGAVGYLVKGATVDEIVRTVHASVLGQATLSAEVMADVIQELSGQLQREERDARVRRERGERIRRAVDEDVISVVFQPIVRLEDAGLVGLEALARFDVEPRRPPDAWFAEAAEAGMVEELELAAIRRACDALPRIPSDAYLSVNVSPETVLSPALRELLRPLPADRLVLEVTQYARVADYGALADGIRSFRGRGGRLAIDDAGAGFATLRHILRLEPDIIKLDTTLTRDIDSDRARRALGAAIISFATEIEAAIVAEGIQTAAELEALRLLGVRFGQGYHIGPPGPLPSWPGAESSGSMATPA
jgi:EAL domain-containing protein (putative c-di-GMP-specific phosphodiesterase class I)/DNA-binding NarL/FixJ family response regulator